jgi:Protein of unknown function (DUF4238)
MGETRRMHFVPQTYMKRFSQERGGEYFIHALPKNGGSIFEPNIKNICVETDIYMIPGTTEKDRQFLENMYHDLYEKGYDSLYKLLSDDAKETITAEERYSIVSFVVSMFYRNNSWGNFHNQLMDDTFEKVYHLARANGKDSFFFEDLEISIVGKTLEELQKENRKQDRPMIAMVTAQKIFELSRLRVLNDFISVVKADPGYEFITSDNPVSFKSKNIKQRPIPFDPTNSLWMPIDKDHLLQVEPWAHELDWKMIGRMKDRPFPGLISSMNNSFQFHQSGKFLLGTETGLKNFQVKPQGILPANS